jgi:hypothetical protein
MTPSNAAITVDHATESTADTDSLTIDSLEDLEITIAPDEKVPSTRQQIATGSEFTALPKSVITSPRSGELSSL